MPVFESKSIIYPEKLALLIYNEEKIPFNYLEKLEHLAISHLVIFNCKIGEKESSFLNYLSDLKKLGINSS